jgi:hypothetical protein
MVHPRYHPFSVRLVMSQWTYNTMLVPQPLYTIVHNTSGTTEFDLGWPTLLMIYVL